MPRKRKYLDEADENALRSAMERIGNAQELCDLCKKVPMDMKGPQADIDYIKAQCEGLLKQFCAPTSK